MHNRSILLIIAILLVGIMAACGKNTHEMYVEPEMESSIEKPSASSSNDEFTESKKTEYLRKLNTTKKELEEVEPTDSSTYALKAVENNRWETWDALLNEIYGVLKEQLPTEEMEHLRDEQRNWIQYRDESALEASLKYQGGTMEHLEYVAVLANLTEERCIELVENYMK